MTDPLKVKLLEFCDLGELVCVEGRWAIVARGPEGRCLIFLSGENAPHRINVPDGPTRCLSYGQEFQLLPDYNSECDMVSPFVRGALYYANRDGRGEFITRHLAVIAHNDGKKMFLRLDDFAFASDVGVPQEAQFASFQHWRLWMNLPPHRDPTLLYEHGR